jgi:hypothetical protein
MHDNDGRTESGKHDSSSNRAPFKIVGSDRSSSQIHHKINEMAERLAGSELGLEVRLRIG